MNDLYKFDPLFVSLMSLTSAQQRRDCLVISITRSMKLFCVHFQLLILLRFPSQVQLVQIKKNLWREET